MTKDIEQEARPVVGGIDTHKDLHVAAVVDERDRVVGTRSFATTRQGYRQLLAWMRSFGDIQRIGVAGARAARGWLRCGQVPDAIDMMILEMGLDS